MDPYKVLGVTPQTSDDDVKRAYRELARKYHPDNYVNNPLADLAETRMKEINEAYDMIMNERRNPAGGSSGQQQSYGGAYNGQQYGGYQQRTYTGANAALYSQCGSHQSATSAWRRRCCREPQDGMRSGSICRHGVLPQGLVR